VNVTHPSDQPSQTGRTVARSHDAHLVVLEGCIDVTRTAELRVTLDTSLAASDDVYVDLSRVSHLDSTALRELLRAQAHAARTEKRFGVVAPSASVRRLLEVADAADILRDR